MQVAKKGIGFQPYSIWGCPTTLALDLDEEVVLGPLLTWRIISFAHLAHILDNPLEPYQEQDR